MIAENSRLGRLHDRPPLHLLDVYPLLLWEFDVATAKVFRSGNSQALRLPQAIPTKKQRSGDFPPRDEIVLRGKSGTMARAFDLLAGLPDDFGIASRTKD